IDERAGVAAGAEVNARGRADRNDGERAILDICVAAVSAGSQKRELPCAKFRQGCAATGERGGESDVLPVGIDVVRGAGAGAESRRIIDLVGTAELQGSAGEGDRSAGPERVCMSEAKGAVIKRRSTGVIVAAGEG